MINMMTLREKVENGLTEVMEKGLSNSNIEIAYKLIDMLKDLENISYWECKEDYYHTVKKSMEQGEYAGNYYDAEDGYSGRHRDSMGRYARDGYPRNDGRMMHSEYDRGSSYRDDGNYSSRGYSRGSDAYDQYIHSKQSYRNSGKSSDCKQRLMGALETYMADFTKQMEEMSRDSDCAEERAIIRSYLDKLRTSL